MKRFLRNNGLKVQMMAIVFGIGFIMFGLMFFSYHRERETARDIISAAVQRNLLQEKAYIDYRMREIEALSNAIASDTDILAALAGAQRSRDGQIVSLDEYYTLRPRIEVYAIAYKNFKIRIYLDDTIFISSEGSYFFPMSILENETWYEEMVSKSGAGSWVVSTLLDDMNQLEYISLVRVLKNPYKNQNVGILQIGLPLEKISDSIDLQDQDQLFDIYFVDDEGGVLFPQGQDLYILTADEKLQNGLFKQIELERGQFHLVGYAPYQVISEQAYSGLILNLALLLVAFGAIIALTFAMYNFIIRRLKTLGNRLEEVEHGDFEELISIKRDDEIGRIEQQFNQMSIRIRELISEVYGLEIKRKEAQMVTLQAQIKPHFLYNILDSISWMAREGNTQRISEVVTALGKFFRLSLSGGEDIIAFRDEIEIIRQYIHLQQVRYEDAFQVEYVIDEDTMNCATPKLLLQPIIENSIKHGILPNIHIREGKIFIRAWLMDGMLYVNILDNGRLDEQKEIQSHGKNKEQNGYGLNNISERLALLYDDAYSLSIFTNEDGSTEVNLAWPAVYMGEEM